MTLRSELNEMKAKLKSGSKHKKKKKNAFSCATLYTATFKRYNLNYCWIKFLMEQIQLCDINTCITVYTVYSNTCDMYYCLSAIYWLHIFLK